MKTTNTWIDFLPWNRKGKILQIYFLLNEDPADQNHHSMHVYDDPAHGRSSVFQKEKEKKRKKVFFVFVFLIDHFSFKNPHL